MRTSGIKSEGVTGNWMELHNKEPITYWHVVVYQNTLIFFQQCCGNLMPR